MTEIRLEHVSYAYGEERILEDINLKVTSGEVVSILGPSGVGKTTLFNLIAGILEVQSGRIVLDGEENPKGRVSYMLQKDLLLEHKTVLGNIILPLLIQKVDKAEAIARADEILATFQLTAAEIYMSFDGNEVIYPRNEWNKITLAYAMSIHKSQGSEFPVVILPITRQSGRMLQRNLIYTAITRAKSKLVMLGEIAAFDYAVRNEGAKRNTFLIQRFEQTYTQAVDKSVEKIVKNLATEAPNQTKTKNNYPSETFENKDFSENINPSQNLVNTYSQPVDKSVNKPVQTEENYRLTEENWATIDPMIGLSEDDIAAFFNNN